MKKRVLIFILGIFLLIGISFVSAELCKGGDGYYYDCDDIYLSNYRNYDTYKEQKAYDYGYKDGYEYGFWNGYKKDYDRGQRYDGKYYNKEYYVKDYDKYDKKVYLKYYDDKRYYDGKIYVKDYDKKYLKKKYYVVYGGGYKKVSAPEYYVYSWSHREDCPSGWVCYEGG